MNNLDSLVVFSLDEERYALHLSSVERIVRAAEITPLPRAPEIVIGVLNVRGQIVPVINIRKRFRLPEREIHLENQLILARTSKRDVALVVDAVSGVVESPKEKIVPVDKILPNTDYIEGVMKLESDIVLIHNLEEFLSLEEEQTLDTALGNLRDT